MEYNFFAEPLLCTWWLHFQKNIFVLGPKLVSIFSWNTTTGFSFVNFVRKIFYWQILCFISIWMLPRFIIPSSLSSCKQLSKIDTQIWFCVTIHEKYVKLLVEISVYLAFEIQVLSMLAINWCRGHFRIFQFPSAIRLQNICRRLNRNLCVLSQQCLWHTSTFSQGLSFGFLITVEIICSIGEHIIQCRKNSALKI